MIDTNILDIFDWVDPGWSQIDWNTWCSNPVDHEIEAVEFSTWICNFDAAQDMVNRGLSPLSHFEVLPILGNTAVLHTEIQSIVMLGSVGWHKSRWVVPVVVWHQRFGSSATERALTIRNIKGGNWEPGTIFPAKPMRYRQALF